jgi:hypothetical protein
VESSNQHQITQVLDVIQRTVGCRITRGLLERPVYREFFAAGNDRPLVFIYYGEGVPRRSLAKLLTRDAARRIAAGIAKLPGLVQWLSKGTH